ncbi:hypothetical protein MPSEU_000454000 [Mayamaea pseudoterrestris]|nr:hypothetical protein MPSEU_000454000 [Mayamaea pseudoterrestris]
MKTAAFLPLLLSVSASAFVTPSTQRAASVTELNALADNIFGLDLFDPKRNKYGAREKKNVKTGTLTSKSYIPSGLTKAEFEKVRARDAAKKEESYKKNVKKAFQFEDFTNFYLKRGTSEGGSWLKAPALGHRMAKTKYDWSNTADAKLFAASVKPSAASAKKAVPATKAVKKATPVAKTSWFGGKK